MYLTGVLQAFGMVVITTLFNVYIRVNSLLFDIEPIVFACTYMIATALTLSIFAGPGRFVNDTLKTPATWLYGFILVGTFTVDIYLVRYISGTELSVLSRIAVPIAMVLAFLFLSRKPIKSDLVNVSALTIGIVGIFMLQTGENLHYVIILGTIAALLQAIVFMLSETHKQSVTAQKIGNLRDRARVVGFVTFITSMIFFVLAISLALIKENTSNILVQESLAFIPEIQKFTHGPTVWAGFVFGLILSPFTRYFQWSATYKIKTENVLTILAIIPFTTLMCEWLLSYHPLFVSNKSAFEGERFYILLSLTIIMAVGAWYSAYLRLTQNVKVTSKISIIKLIKKASEVKKEGLEIQQSANAMDDFEIVKATLEYAGGDKEKASKLLKISPDAITVLLDGGGSLALTVDASQELSRNFRRNVANADALTGLANRTAFMSALKDAVKSNAKFTIFFLDLNKFKPINDTHGHEAGDFILKTVAKRLTDELPKNATISRLGGDEFVILSKGEEEKVPALSTKITSIIEAPIHLESKNVTVSVGVSIGIASYPSHGKTAEELLNTADHKMYKEKENR